MAAEHPNPWLIYALGGGLGHLTRATALARALRTRRPQHPLHLVTNSPFARHPCVLQTVRSFCRPHLIPADCDRQEVTERVGTLLARYARGGLIVDTFPRGLAGELADWLPTFAGRRVLRRVLVHRDLNPCYVDDCHVRETLADYDLVLAPGERGPLADSPKVVSTAPWLVCDRDNLLTRSEARERLGIADDERPCVAVVGSGRPEECRAFARLAKDLREAAGRRAHVLLISLDRAADTDANCETPHCRPNLWPLLECAAGVDLVVGAGGYNTVWECRAAQRPLLAVAQSRLYDRQARRLDAGERVSSLDRAPGRVLEALAHWRQPIPVPPFTSGAHAAARAIFANTRRNTPFVSQPTGSILARRS